LADTLSKLSALWITGGRDSGGITRALRSAIVVGAGHTGQALTRLLEANRNYGYTVLGFLDEDHHDNAQMLDKIRDLAISHRIDTVFVTRETNVSHLRWLSLQGAEHGFGVHLVSGPSDTSNLGAMKSLGPFSIVPLYDVSSSRWELWLKRTIDVIFATAALLLTLFWFPLIALLIKIDSPGPVFHRSPRVGKGGRQFVCHKFRTMVVGAESMQEALWHLNEREGLLFKLSNDPRVTRVGKLLRKYSIDELPQFWDVLSGNMSLVGPRPPLPTECAKYTADHMGRLAVTPGITGLWQVAARRDPSFDSYIKLDLEYVQKRSLALDLKILVQTIPLVFKGTGQ
jgi:exopolysaccharide biosynthesis polyprenyl glycosylphosphotransferase